jgi:hypothetical protein
MTSQIRSPDNLSAGPLPERRVVFLRPARGYVTIVTVDAVTGDEWAGTVPIAEARIVGGDSGCAALEAVVAGQSAPFRVESLTAAHVEQLRACGVGVPAVPRL